MARRLKHLLKRYNPLEQGKIEQPLHPDDILFDAHNLSSFGTGQFEGRLERPIGTYSLYAVIVSFLLLAALFGYQLFSLQIKEGSEYKLKSEQNRLHHSTIFAERGLILDRHLMPIAWNESRGNSGEDGVPRRVYTSLPGLGHLLGYVAYPAKDKSGVYFSDIFVGKDGVEMEYDSLLSGKNGVKITETNVHGQTESESQLEPPQRGKNITLSVDAELTSTLHKNIKSLAERAGFSGGAGIIMDVHSGEILALTSYPEYNSGVLSEGSDQELIQRYREDKNSVFLNRAVFGVYTPGSVVKPFVAVGALTEKIIDPQKQILSTGSISISNPYFKDQKSVFSDWKAHGWVDMRHALAVSSNVYFYEIGGGYKEQPGLGIARLEKYFKLFGFGSLTGVDMPGEVEGTIPTPEWKARHFDGEPWRLGDTYFTAIGQYGMQVTLLQAVRAVAAIASSGILPTPSVRTDNTSEVMRLPIPERYFEIVREGMRLGVLEGTAMALKNDFVEVAGKTGTAELGSSKEQVNSWVLGFFPYKEPRYAFAVLMEQGPRQNLTGSAFIVREVLAWMKLNRSEYLKDSGSTLTSKGVEGSMLP